MPGVQSSHFASHFGALRPPSRAWLAGHGRCDRTEPRVCGCQASRRQAMLSLPGATATWVFLGPASAMDGGSGAVGYLEMQAFQAYSRMDFPLTIQLLDKVIARQDDPRWREWRGAVHVDSKQFEEGVRDYDAAIAGQEELFRETAAADQRMTQARASVMGRLLSGRALAKEGTSDWRGALSDYDQALAVTASAGLLPDPYVLNDRGNVLASLGLWREARQAYLESSEGFQRAKGFFDSTGYTSTQRQDGAVLAASNAALMLAQMGDVPGAVAEMERVVRRAPGSVDMRAALAALLWSQGRGEAAEASWEFACDRITAGCGFYEDLDSDWLRRVRRWPPRMIEYLSDFLAIRGARS